MKKFSDALKFPAVITRDPRVRALMFLPFFTYCMLCTPAHAQYSGVDLLKKCQQVSLNKIPVSYTTLYKLVQVGEADTQSLMADVSITGVNSMSMRYPVNGSEFIETLLDSTVSSWLIDKSRKTIRPNTIHSKRLPHIVQSGASYFLGSLIYFHGMENQSRISIVGETIVAGKNCYIVQVVYPDQDIFTQMRLHFYIDMVSFSLVKRSGEICYNRVSQQAL